MILYLFITALTVTMAFFVNSAYVGQQNNRSGRERQRFLNLLLVVGIFVILFALSALRIGIGNDYWPYRDSFRYIWGGDRKISYEFGFRYLVLFLQKIFGFDNYRVIFAVMAFLTCAFFLKGMYDTSDWFAMTFILFMANGFYFMSFSNVRYYLALAISMFSLRYVLQKDFVKFVFWILMGALFHKTILLVIPVYLTAYYLKWNRRTVWLIPAACCALLAGKPLIRKLLFVFYPFYQGDLILDVESVSYINIAKCLAILIFALIFYKKGVRGNPKAEMCFNLNLFATILYSFGYYILQTSRICYYMVLGQIFLVPMVLRSIENKLLRRLCTGTILVAYLIYFLVFLERGKQSGIMILPYMTWLFT